MPIRSTLRRLSSRTRRSAISEPRRGARHVGGLPQLVLNQRIEASLPFVMPVQWKACAGEPRDLRERDVFVGLDVSETRDLTALVLVGSTSATTRLF
jgi:hypothetical protein